MGWKESSCFSVVFYNETDIGVKTVGNVQVIKQIIL